MYGKRESKVREAGGSDPPVPPPPPHLYKWSLHYSYLDFCKLTCICVKCFDHFTLMLFRFVCTKTTFPPVSTQISPPSFISPLKLGSQVTLF